jgi:uncharacterized SAM-binding protein YcdF (DUF218 family)
MELSPFLLKKTLAPFLYPLPLVLSLLGLGLFFLWLTPWRRAGRLFVTLGGLLLAALSWGPLPDRLAGSLEDRYPPLTSLKGLQEIRWVAVLGGGHSSDPRLPVTGQVDDSTLVRLTEGIRIHRQLPRSKLLLSGGGPFDPVSNAQIMGELALALGVDQAALVLEARSRDTEDEAVEIRKIVGTDPFVLVTSATHMPRSMAIFQARGMKPVPAPTGQLVKRRTIPHPGHYFPTLEGLRKVQRAVHEHAGMAWMAVRRFLDDPAGPRVP